MATPAPTATDHGHMLYDGQPWESQCEGCTRNVDDPTVSHEGWIACYLRQEGRIYLTYWTTGRGDEVMNGAAHALLDMTAYGRREEWEDSPEGWPQLPDLRLDAHRRARCAEGAQKRRSTGAPVDPPGRDRGRAVTFVTGR